MLWSQISKHVEATLDGVMVTASKSFEIQASNMDVKGYSSKISDRHEEHVIGN